MLFRKKTNQSRKYTSLRYKHYNKDLKLARLEENARAAK